MEASIDSNISTLKRRRLNSTILYYISAFALPFLFTLIVFIIAGIYPFGARTLLTVDCYHQYVPFLIEFRNKVLSGESLFYTWNNGLGMEYYAAFANYCSSPLNIFALFFTAKTMPIFVLIVTTVRAGLASLFMMLFLSDSEKRKPDMITLSFSVMYALCGWFLTDFWNIMWCDALVLLPLICYGLRQMLFKGKYAVYVLSLFAAIASNYYSGYFLCLFLVLFAPVMYITEAVGKNEKNNGGTELSVGSFFKCVGRFALGSIAAGCMTAIITIPTFFILQNTSATGANLEWNFKLENDLFDFLGRFFVCANPNIRDGMANVYSGTLTVFLLPLFFMAPKCTGIKLRHKICYGFLLTVLYLSLTNRTLTFIWHGFHFPNQIPHRESFLMSFVLVYMAFKVIRNIRAYERNIISRIAVLYIGFVFLFEKLGEGKESYAQFFISILFITLVGAILYSIRTASKSRKGLACTLTAVVLCESFIAATFIICTVGENESFPSYDYYGKNYSEIQDYFDGVINSDDHSIFERTEIYPNYICNIESVYDLKGISVFSSTARESFVKYMENYGLASNGINSIRAFGLTRPTASLFGIRNAVTTTVTNNVPLFFDKVTEVSDSVKVYENKDALSVGYMVSEDMLDYAPDSVNMDPFVDLNDLTRAMGYNADLYQRVFASDDGCEGAKVITDNISDLCYNVTENGKVVLNFSVSGTYEGSDVYVYIQSTSDGKVTVLQEAESQNKPFDVKSKQIISIGKYHGEPIKVKAEYASAKSGMFRVYVYEVNEENYHEMLDLLDDNQLNVTDYTSDTLTGDITATQDGLLLLTIPYSEGFVAEVDGKEAELLSVQDALCAIKLSSGTHHVVVKYLPPFFSLGEAVTLAGIIMLLLLIVIPRITAYIKSKKSDKATLAVSDTVDSVADSESTAEAESEVIEAVMSASSEPSQE
ncbi:MAG: YfhO family protein [Clostridia bacterium]|nr:YfhO family protein [Clostridia bacterium]